MDAMHTSGQSASLTEQEAQRELDELIESQRARALWFLRPDIHVAITDPSAARVLSSLAQHGSREAWIRVRTLQRWRLQHTR
jgi:hypothetical protein